MSKVNIKFVELLTLRNLTSDNFRWRICLCIAVWTVVVLFVFGSVGCDTVTSLSAQADVSTSRGFVSSAERLQKVAERAATHVEMVLDMDLGDWTVRIGDPTALARTGGQGRGVDELQQTGLQILAFTEGDTIVVDPRLAESRWHSTLVHEMVHVAQYRRMGGSMVEKGTWHQRNMKKRYGKELTADDVVSVRRAFNALAEAQAYHIAYELDGEYPPMMQMDNGFLLCVMGEVRRLGHERIFEILNSEQFLTDLQEVNVP
jgi:hypothetical protein